MNLRKRNKSGRMINLTAHLPNLQSSLSPARRTTSKLAAAVWVLVLTIIISLVLKFSLF